MNKRKLQQVAAFLLSKTDKGKMDIYKLMQMIYLAERESIKSYGFPMLGGETVCTDDGIFLASAIKAMGKK